MPSGEKARLQTNAWCFFKTNGFIVASGASSGQRSISPVGAANGQDVAIGREGHALARRAADGRRAAGPQVDDGYRAGRRADRGREAAHGQGVAVRREGQADGVMPWLIDLGG